MHSLRQARHDAVKRCGDAKYAALNSELAQREIAAILRSDLTLIISESEMALLTEHYGVPKAQLYYHPLVVGPTPSYATTFEGVHISFISEISVMLPIGTQFYTLSKRSGPLLKKRFPMQSFTFTVPTLLKRRHSCITTNKVF
jgi:hypothetical protein